MKKILFALLIGGVSYNTSAQSESKYAQNYPVCRDESGNYMVCGSDKGPTNESNSRVSSYSATRKVSTSAGAVPCVNITQAGAPYTGEKVGYRWDRQQKVSVQYDGMAAQAPEPKAPATGQESRQYDGPDQNAKRNLNYGSGMPLPPSTGEIR